MIIPNPESDGTDSFMFVTYTQNVDIKIFTKAINPAIYKGLIKWTTIKILEEMDPVNFTLSSKYQVLSVDYLMNNQLGFNTIYYYTTNPWGGTGENILYQQAFTFTSTKTMEAGVGLDTGIVVPSGYNNK